MNFLEIAKNRYSSRSYLEKEIEEEKLLYVLAAARVAPSAVNKQPWHFVVIREEKQLEKIKACYARDWINSAPAIIVAIVDHQKSWIRRDGKDHADIDISIAVDHMTLAATEQGLATCWVCNFQREEVAKLLDLPENLEPAVVLPIGYPTDSPKPERHDNLRKGLDEIVHWEKF